MVLSKWLPIHKKQEQLLRRQDNPMNWMERIHRELFSDFFGGSWLEPFEPMSKVFTPNVDVTEDRKYVYVNTELPGMVEKDIELILRQDHLILRGEKKEDYAHEERDFYQRESHYGAFKRMIKLPAEVNSDRIDARYKKGMLKVKIPKLHPEKKQVKTITIQGE
ncbi:MAG: Hsp20/alpha crystallin family protein [Sedimentisphaerales bacterium]|nr:Hsp20/alpha crystallin family protein [Sedimentisphaerales bacterium]